jgi:glutathionylspermidine amidase/synthetase
MTLAKNKKILLIILTIIVILIIFLVYKYFEKEYKFGDKIGTFNGVDAYSNQRDETNSLDPNYYKGIYTGQKWQCVEFARRYLIINEGITFSDVDSAFEIPKAQFKTLNGVLVQMSNELKKGSLIVWSKSYEKRSPDGHVAIVSLVTPFGVTVVEQNYKYDAFSRFIKTSDLKNTTIIGSPR